MKPPLQRRALLWRRGRPLWHFGWPPVPPDL